MTENFCMLCSCLGNKINNWEWSPKKRKKSWTGSFSPERNLGNLSTQRSLRSPCTGALRDKSLRVPCNWASKSAIGQIYLISEGLTREAGHHFRCMKHAAILWNTYGDALLSWKKFINSYMSKKSKHQEYPACLLFICAATSYSHKGKPFTTIGAKKLNFCVRDGNRCDLLAIVTAHF